MTGGERRLAYRLEQKLEDDWLLWYDVPLGPHNVHPDFVVFNPRRPPRPKTAGHQAADATGRSRLHRPTPQGSPQDRHPVERHVGHLPRLRHRQTRTGDATQSRHTGAYQDDITFAEKEDTVKFLTMHSCKRLEFPLVAIPGVGRAAVDDARKGEEARLLYVAMTRTTGKLIVT